MTIYAVEVKGDITNNEWSIVTIWRNVDDAEKAMRNYKLNCTDNDIDSEYRIKELDTDNDCVYDYDEE